MRIKVPDSPYTSPEPSPPPSPELKPVASTSHVRRTSNKSLNRSGSSNAHSHGEAGPSRQTPERKLACSGATPSPKSALAEKNTDIPQQPLTWEQSQFYVAVRLHQRKDPVEEYEDRQRRIAWQEAQERTSRTWGPIADLLQLPSASSPTTAQPLRSPPLDKVIEDAHAAQVEELDAIFRELSTDTEAERLQKIRMEQSRKQMWEDIESTIKMEEARLAKIAAEQAAARKAEEERLRKAKEAKEAEQRAAEAEAKRKVEAEAALKKKLEEEKEKAQKKKEEDEARQKEEEEKRKQNEAAGQAAPKSALLEWEGYRETLRKLKTEIMPLVRGNKADDSMINKEWRKIWNTTRRSFNTRIGQVTNSQAEIDRIAKSIHESLRPNPPHPGPLYIALLASLAKAFLLQAETEVTASAQTAFPLARLALKILELGNEGFAEIFMARLVGRTGPWAVGVVIPRYAEQTDADFRKTMGYPPITSSESSSQITDRFVGMITLYAAILQTKSTPTARFGGFGQPAIPAPIATAPYPFQLPRLWTLLARLGSSSQLLADKTAPQIIYALVETAGDRLLEVYGKQVVKMMKTIGSRCVLEGDGEGMVGGKEGKAARVRLGLLLEKWQKEGRVGGTGREVNP